MRRAFWFVAGAGSSFYLMAKARRAREALTREGLQDRLAGLSLGAHLFRDEVRAQSATKETELRNRLHLRLHGTPELSEATAAGAAPGPDKPVRSID